MARKVVRDIIDEFRSRFQEQTQAEVPLALRQEAPDVVFSALLEDDKPAQPLGGPLMDGLDDLELSEVPGALPGGMGAGMDLDGLLGLSGGAGAPPMPNPLDALMDPMAQPGMAPPAAPADLPEF